MVAVRLTEAGFDKENAPEQLASLREELRSLRVELEKQDVAVPENIPESMREMLREIGKGKLKISYQTTVVAARFHMDSHSIYMDYIKCGDSDLTVFDAEGSVVYPPWSVGDAVPRRGSNVTDVLPDSPEERVIYQRVSLSEWPGFSVLVATDGLYNAFDSFRDLYQWLTEHREQLPSAESDNPRVASDGGSSSLYEGLHTRLRQTVGDDDISFVWVLLSNTEAR